MSYVPRLGRLNDDVVLLLSGRTTMWWSCHHWSTRTTIHSYASSPSGGLSAPEPGATPESPGDVIGGINGGRRRAQLRRGNSSTVAPPEDSPAAGGGAGAGAKRTPHAASGSGEHTPELPA